MPASATTALEGRPPVRATARPSFRRAFRWPGLGRARRFVVPVLLILLWQAAAEAGLPGLSKLRAAEPAAVPELHFTGADGADRFFALTEGDNRNILAAQLASEMLDLLGQLVGERRLGGSTLFGAGRQT